MPTSVVVGVTGRRKAVRSSQLLGDLGRRQVLVLHRRLGVDKDRRQVAPDQRHQSARRVVLDVVNPTVDLAGKVALGEVLGVCRKAGNGSTNPSVSADSQLASRSGGSSPSAKFTRKVSAW
ncbi:hypothetical protein [Cupriavidus sp. USMAA2-4]|uniref:hypothetical protein n=1 Tax=Cupriavidus sp. USMAA2-4 TaxID=876364 RepID=UPI0012F5001D|nr:hypothetical protein [Cupriavidus sp. USMAA2-4]